MKEEKRIIYGALNLRCLDLEKEITLCNGRLYELLQNKGTPSEVRLNQIERLKVEIKIIEKFMKTLIK